jgi:3D (Asp-Asp-Asp) domain-containing protein
MEARTRRAIIIGLVILGLGVVLGRGAAVHAQPESVVLDGFERGVFQGWQLTGDCWGSAPEGSRYGGARFSGWSGSYYASSAHPKAGDYKMGSGTGVAHSREFRITHTQLRFRIGGGNYPQQCYLSLIVKDQDGSERVAHTQTGNDSDRLDEASWDVSELVGKRARLELVDKLAFGSRAYILVDDLELTGRPAQPVSLSAPAPVIEPEREPAPVPVAQPQPEPTARPVRTGPLMQIEGKLPRPTAQSGTDGPRESIALPDGRVLTGRRITLEATGYGPGENGQWGDQTALGTKVGYGTVAVDPKVIPLRTRLWVEGYGECIALDTGGAIKGLRIDLGFGDDITANQYGRKKVKVIILD